MKELVQLSIALKTLGYHNLSQSILKIGQQTRKTNLQKIEISSSKILSDPNNPSSATKGYKLTITPIVDGQKGQSQTIDYLLGGGVKLLPQGDKNPQSILDNIIGDNNITPSMFSLNFLDGKTNLDFGLNLK
jgi:type II secretory pathway component PulJ